MFRFDNSRHALSVSSYIKEQRDKELASQIKVWYCGCGQNINRHGYHGDGCTCHIFVLVYI